MKGIIACLAAASTVLAREKVFNIHDDLDAFPHVSTAVSQHTWLPVESYWWIEGVMNSPGTGAHSGAGELAEHVLRSKQPRTKLISVAVQNSLRPLHHLPRRSSEPHLT